MPNAGKYKWLMLLILGLQSISRDAENSGSHPRRLDPTMELITYSFVLYLQTGRRDVKCKPSMPKFKIQMTSSRKRFANTIIEFGSRRV